MSNLYPDSLPLESKPTAGGRSGGGKTTLTESIRMSIESDIFSGTLPPGSPIDEDSIAARFSVSRTPVREAVMQLIEAGLIQKNSRQRAKVARLDVKRLLQLFEALAEMEGTCARLAARRANAADKDAMVANHRAAAEALAAGAEDEYFRLGRRFHALIIRATHNNVLIELTHKLVAPLLPYRRFQLRRDGRPEANQSDHDLILATILEGNSTAAYDLMRRHNTIQADTLAEYVSMDDGQILA